MKRTKNEEVKVDEHEGQGGSYVVVDGKRELVERTREPSLPDHEANKKGE